MSTISDIPLYEIIQEIESFHGEGRHMVIEIITNDDATTDKPHPLIREEDIYRPNGWQLNDNIFFWCEFENQVAVFDNVPAMKNWFMVDCVRENSEDNLPEDGPKVRQDWNTFQQWEGQPYWGNVEE